MLKELYISQPNKSVPLQVSGECLSISYSTKERQNPKICGFCKRISWSSHSYIQAIQFDEYLEQNNIGAKSKQSTQPPQFWKANDIMDQQSLNMQLFSSL